MEDIIKSISEAEEKAAEIKNDALNKAHEIAAKAEEKAEEIKKENAAQLKLYRENAIAAAEAAAQKAYADSIEKQRAQAEKYADSLIKDADFYVNDVVRRISGGTR